MTELLRGMNTTTMLARKGTSPERASHGAFAALLAVYAITLAPSVTLWDAGEILSAIRTLGVPHPPGTPLFVFLARTWSLALGFVPFTVAVNFGSAVAGAIGAASIARAFGEKTHPAVVLGAGVLGGLALAVWQNATETEVYAYSLCLVGLMLVVALRARDPRFTRLLCFLFGLAAPLHLSVLVAGPAVIVLAAYRGEEGIAWDRSASLGSAWLLAVGVGTVSVIPIAAALGLSAVRLFVLRPRPARAWDVVAPFALSVLGASFVLVMLVRAQHDPAVNQGDPSTWQRLLDVIGRAQYDVPPLWPRRAPVWLQVGNMVQYADWQWFFGFDGQPGASWVRTPVTMLFAALSLVGARAIWRADRGRFWALVLLFGCATLGVVAVLNLRAGPSYGWGVLANDALREARERDYFFALAFVCWAVFIAAGAWSLTGRPLVVGALGFLPLVGNWHAANRRALPDGRLAEALGVETLTEAPERSVLLLAGDNDSYAVWWAQQVLRLRRDVIPVTASLLPAQWYREELQRRAQLMDSATIEVWRGEASTLAALGDAAARLSRPVAVGTAVPAALRTRLGASWTLTGVVWTKAMAAGQGVDSNAARAARERVMARGVLSASARDPAARYVQALLRCPGAALQGETALLESKCNYR